MESNKIITNNTSLKNYKLQLLKARSLTLLYENKMFKYIGEVNVNNNAHQGLKKSEIFYK
jgi:hypothetical protein